MKKSSIICLVVCLALALCACGEVAPSEGLEFTSNGDGTCLLTGIGTCMDTEVIVPDESPDGDTVVGVGDSAFQFCYDMTSVTFPESVTYFDSYAVSHCDSLEEITINGEISEMVDWAFEDLPALKKVTMAGGVNYYGEALLDYDWMDENDEYYSNEDYARVIVELYICSEEPEGNEYSIERAVTEDNDDFVYCSIFDKESIIVNGKTYTMPDMEEPMGVYDQQCNWTAYFEFGEDNTFSCKYALGDDEVFYEGTYTLSEETGCYLAESDRVCIEFCLL